jgi:hypothetical protein
VEREADTSKSEELLESTTSVPKKRKLIIDESQTLESRENTAEILPEAEEPARNRTQGTQTSWCGISAFSIPVLPEIGNVEELQACLVWLSDGMELLQRTKELVEKRLQQGKGDTEHENEL